MNRTKLSAALIVVLTTIVQVVVADPASDKSNGKWVAGNFFQVNVACTQAWICVAPDVLHGPDTHVVTTSNSSTQGVCGAGDGPVDSCNLCLANPPTQACQYWLESNSSSSNSIKSFSKKISIQTPTSGNTNSSEQDSRLR